MPLMDHMFWAGPRANRSGMRGYTGAVLTAVGGIIAIADTPFFEVSKQGVGLYRIRLMSASSGGHEVLGKRLGNFNVTIHSPPVGPSSYTTDKALHHFIAQMADPSGTVVGPTNPFSRFNVQFCRALTVGATSTYVNAEIEDGATMFFDFTVKHSSA
jgi:hypothetical protein